VSIFIFINKLELVLILLFKIDIWDFNSFELFLFKEKKVLELFSETIKRELEVSVFRNTKSFELFIIDNNILFEYS
jgi:hypothetical protein